MHSTLGAGQSGWGPSQGQHHWSPQQAMAFLPNQLRATNPRQRYRMPGMWNHRYHLASMPTNCQPQRSDPSSMSFDVLSSFCGPAVQTGVAL